MRRPSFGGLAGAVVFWWQSLTPSLLPRPWYLQSAVSAVCMAAGYGLGALAGSTGHLVLDRAGHPPAERARTMAWRGLVAATVVVVVVGLVVWPRWQDEHRAVVGLGGVSRMDLVPMVTLTVALTLFVAALCRLGWVAIRRLDLWFNRHLSRSLAVAGTAVVVVVGTQLLFREVVWDGFVRTANVLYSTADTGTDAGTEQPTTPLVSGSPASLVHWDDLGVKGRNFVARPTTLEELAAFHGPEADLSEPIRVYVGARSSDSLEEQVALAVRELERTGAFDRSVLVVATATGTGWINPGSATAVEHLHAGDTAIVSVQYSYLPSWITFLIDPAEAAPAGSELFHAVYARWDELPESSRPLLLVYGESLGSLGAEAAFAGFDATSSIADMAARSDGALFVGPVFDNMIWREVVAERDAGSPAWRPVFEDGETVRVFNHPDDLVELDPTWEAPRVVYLHHPTDPVGVLSVRALWSRPDWVTEPRGHGIPDRAGWFPVVTAVQTVADLAYSFYAPVGYGHDYGHDFVGGWANVAAPDGWTGADTERLLEHVTAAP